MASVCCGGTQGQRSTFEAVYISSEAPPGPWVRRSTMALAGLSADHTVCSRACSRPCRVPLHGLCMATLLRVIEYCGLPITPHALLYRCASRGIKCADIVLIQVYLIQVLHFILKDRTRPSTQLLRICMAFGVTLSFSHVVVAFR